MCRFSARAASPIRLPTFLRWCSTSRSRRLPTAATCRPIPQVRRRESQASSTLPQAKLCPTSPLPRWAPMAGSRCDFLPLRRATPTCSSTCSAGSLPARMQRTEPVSCRSGPLAFGIRVRRRSMQLGSPLVRPKQFGCPFVAPIHKPRPSPTSCPIVPMSWVWCSMSPASTPNPTTCRRSSACCPTTPWGR